MQAEGYHGAYDSVQRHVKAWKTAASVRGTVTQAFVPLSFAPGEVGQFDWSYEHVVLGGVSQTIKLAHFRLTHSRAMLVVAYPREPGDPGTPSPQVATPAPAPAPDEKVSCECPRSAVEAGLSIKVCTCKP